MNSEYPKKDRARQARFMAAYKASDRELTATLNKMFEGEAPKLYVLHHAKALAHKVVNAANYDRTKANGLTVVVVTHPSLTVPVYGYAVCDKRDNYSRVIGRVHAKESLIRYLSKGNALTLDVPEQTQNRDQRLHEWHRYITQVVKAVCPKVKQKPEEVKVKPRLLDFLEEDALLLEVKQKIARVFGVDTKSIQTKFAFVRRFENKFFGNQYATLSHLEDALAENPDDKIQINSTGGVTVGAMIFPYEGKDHVIYNASLCLPDDQFVKATGRKSVLNFMRNAWILSEDYSSDPSKRPKDTHPSMATGITRLSDDVVKELFMDRLAETAVSHRYGISVNAYVGGTE